MFDGIEVDVLSIGDADSILVTQWNPLYGPARVLIDGGSASTAEVVKEFLHRRNFTELWAVVCTHPHNDHAKGLIRLVQDKSITIRNAWMHDIRNHVSSDALRRASTGNSSQAESVREVIETTKELRMAFAGRGLTIKEPFLGESIAGWPALTVLGPSVGFYRSTIEEFTKIEVEIFVPPPSWGTASIPSGYSPALPPRHFRLSTLMSSPVSAPTPLVPLRGVLRESSVKVNPSTQPFNNTSVILGAMYNQSELLFTADAGTDALSRIHPVWRHLTWMQVPHHGSDGNLSQELIERFCPKFANISACGDSSHPSRAIVNGLIKVGSQVFSTHLSGDLWFRIGNVPARADYVAVAPMKGTGNLTPVIGLEALLRGL